MARGDSVKMCRGEEATGSLDNPKYNGSREENRNGFSFCLKYFERRMMQ